MSILYALIFLIALGGAGFGGWKAALYWDNRTRDARHEDPRDQEIRELSAALSIARKNLEKLDSRSGSSAHELAVLQDQVNKTAAALAESQGKIAAANAAVNREIETRETLDTRIAQMSRELDTAKSRVAELEVQVKIVSPSSGLVAGLDDVLEDDEKEVFTIRHEHKVYKQQVADLEQSLATEKAESSRWKQHCNVLGKTSKTLRERIDSMVEQLKEIEPLREKAAQLVTATKENETLRNNIDELRVIAAEVPGLNARVTQLSGVENENRDLKARLAELSEVHAINEKLTAELADFEATKARLSDAERHIEQLNKQVIELSKVREENDKLRSRVDALAVVETENDSLRNDVRRIQSTHSEELGRMLQQRDELQTRVTALSQIEAENEKLLVENRQLRHVQSENADLQAQLAILVNVNRDNAALNQELAGLRLSEEAQRGANQELSNQIGSLKEDLEKAGELKSQLADANAECARTTANLLELREVIQELHTARDESLRIQAAESGQLRLQIETLAAEKAAIQQAVITAQAENSVINAKLTEAHGSHSAASAQAAGLRIANESLQTMVTELQKLQSEHDSLLQQASDELRIAQAENSKLRLQLAEHESQLQPDAASQDSKPSAPSGADMPDANAAAENDDTDSLPVLTMPELQDDLKSIRGVGAKLEQKLNMIGICNFRDLAELDESTCTRAAQLIPDLANRIERHNWKQQARDLHRQKYNEAL